MNEQPVIMVQIADPLWTWEVLHSACRLALSRGARIVLVKMVPVKHILYLGTPMGYIGLDQRERYVLEAYADTVADYGLACQIELYQYCDLIGAIADAADQVGAATVFAKPPHSLIPFWGDARFEVLRHHLEQRHLRLYGKALDAVQ